MKYETGTFELRDNEMMMRELSSAETNEVAGGTGFASVSAAVQAGPAAGSSVSTTASNFFLAASNTAAQGVISMTVSAVGQVSLSTSSFSEVF